MIADLSFFLQAGAGGVFIARQRYDAIGPRQSRVLAFDKGDELEVMNPVMGSEWWEATSLRTGKQGEVPSSYLVRKHDEQFPEQMRCVTSYTLDTVYTISCTL